MEVEERSREDLSPIWIQRERDVVVHRCMYCVDRSLSLASLSPRSFFSLLQVRLHHLIVILCLFSF